MPNKPKHFCEISPTTYKISVFKQKSIRHIKDFFSFQKFAKYKDDTKLPVIIYKHNSLMRRKLGNTQLHLQENKVENLKIASPKVSGIIIRPKEVFSFWRLVGSCTKEKGYKEGLIISLDIVDKGIGGGMCQFTNLIHWLILHTPLDIVEHHHHDRFDLFPDYGRQVPFGTGTSILYNYYDYRFKNNTNQDYQLIVYTTDEYLCGEIRTTKKLDIKYHIKTEDEKFIQKGQDIFRIGKVIRRSIDKNTGVTIKQEIIKENYAKVMYDTSNLKIEQIEK